MKVFILFLMVLISTSSFFIFGASDKHLKLASFSYLESQLPDGYVAQDSKSSYLGSVVYECNQFHIVLIKQTFGASSKLVRRMAIFNEHGKLLSVYSGFNDDPNKVTAKGVVFDYPESEGNILLIGKKGPQEQVYLDGEFIEAEIINEL